MSFASIAIVCGILAAGLWPLHQPRNDVHWLPKQDGLQFGDFGTIVSSAAFQMPVPSNAAASSLEIWLQPDLARDSNTILAFSQRDNPVQFALRQSDSSLLIAHTIDSHAHRTETIGIDDVFCQRNQVFITITSGARGTATYVDGALVKVFPTFVLGQALTGTLVVGTSPVVSDTWAGQLRGLAIYYRELGAAQVRQHYQTWVKDGQPAFTSGERPIALYLFNERSGNTAHNRIHAGVDLSIPEQYSLLRQVRFQPFWTEYRPFREHWLDILLNVIAFIPLGFLLYGVCSFEKLTRALVLTTCFGFLVSLTIEFLQSYLPTRHSGTMDLITNTLGTFVGAKLYASNAARMLLPGTRFTFSKTH